MRFELTEACTSPPFQDGALNRSANPPNAFLIIPKAEGFVIINTHRMVIYYDNKMNNDLILRSF